MQRSQLLAWRCTPFAAVGGRPFENFPLALGLLAIAVLLSNPHVYLQDTVLFGLSLGLGFIGLRRYRAVSSAWTVVAVTMWFLVSLTMTFQANSNLNLVTPMATAMLLILTGVLTRQALTGTDQSPKSHMYEPPEASSVRSQMAS